MADHPPNVQFVQGTMTRQEALSLLQRTTTHDPSVTTVGCPVPSPSRETWEEKRMSTFLRLSPRDFCKCILKIARKGVVNSRLEWSYRGTSVSAYELPYVHLESIDEPQLLLCPKEC